ncbi:hypothetical protein DVH24_039262 [Malus domestica]|uniref:Uncharacterized protein n=1 Tax=Malus domestica TaxID=3750 RepID=A0A498I3B4_MALDO|nr:hypothetical protein DVH24_039262 [Malus domestica]
MGYHLYSNQLMLITLTRAKFFLWKACESSQSYQGREQWREERKLGRRLLPLPLSFSGRRSLLLLLNCFLRLFYWMVPRKRAKGEKAEHLFDCVLIKDVLPISSHGALTFDEAQLQVGSYLADFSPCYFQFSVPFVILFYEYVIGYRRLQQTYNST